MKKLLINEIKWMRVLRNKCKNWLSSSGGISKSTYIYMVKVASNKISWNCCCVSPEVELTERLRDKSHCCKSRVSSVFLFFFNCLQFWLVAVVRSADTRNYPDVPSHFKKSPATTIWAFSSRNKNSITLSVRKYFP